MSLTVEQREQAEADTAEKRIAQFEAIVRREAGVQVKQGKTNGRPCLHIIKDPGEFFDNRQPLPPMSYTIYEESEWDGHPWNSEGKREKRENQDVLAAIANKEAA